MHNEWLTEWLRWLGGAPCCRIFGRGCREPSWRVIDLFATARRAADSRWPLWRGTCITWSAEVIVVGPDFARAFLREQFNVPASRSLPVSPAGGRIRDRARRLAAGGREHATASEVVAHECGHTWQALRLGLAYLPLVGAVTLFGEGPHAWNYFENQASEEGQLGGLVPGSVRPDWLGSSHPSQP